MLPFKFQGFFHLMNLFKAKAVCHLRPHVINFLLEVPSLVHCLFNIFIHGFKFSFLPKVVPYRGVNHRRLGSSLLFDCMQGRYQLLNLFRKPQVLCFQLIQPVLLLRFFHRRHCVSEYLEILPTLLLGLRNLLRFFLRKVQRLLFARRERGRLVTIISVFLIQDLLLL